MAAFHQGFELWARWRRIVQGMDECVVQLRIEDEKPLIQKHVDRGLERTFDHELRARLSDKHSRIIDQLPRLGLYAKIDGAAAHGDRAGGSAR
jgi:hypothetical protein